MPRNFIYQTRVKRIAIIILNKIQIRLFNYYNQRTLHINDNVQQFSNTRDYSEIKSQLTAFFIIYYRPFYRPRRLNIGGWQLATHICLAALLKGLKHIDFCSCRGDGNKTLTREFLPDTSTTTPLRFANVS